MRQPAYPGGGSMIAVGRQRGTWSEREFQKRVAMILLGHSTRSIFERFNIVNERDLAEAGDRPLQYIDRQSAALR